jgi:cell division septation protein DedD
MQIEEPELESNGKQGGKAESRMPWLDSIDESELQFEDDSIRKTWLIASAAILALILLSGLIWYLYGRTSGNGPGEPFLVQAPDGPTKVEPAERGGMEVPHQERLVFGRVSGEEKPMKESLKEGPEEPLERRRPAPEPVQPAGEIPNQTEPAVTMPPVEEIPPPEPRTKTVPVALAGNYRLQLGAFGQEEGARTSWLAMQNRHPSVLSALDFGIEPVVVGARTLYRLRAGPYSSRLEAENACGRLQAAGQDCHVVVP